MWMEERIERYDEATSRFLQFCEDAYKMHLFHEVVNINILRTGDADLRFYITTV